MKFFYTLVVFLIFLSEVSSQLNVKIGYNLDYSSYKTHNSIFSQFNSSRPWLAEKLGNIHISNGIQLGLRYRGEYAGIDLTYERASLERSAAGVDPDGLSVSKEFDYITNRFSTGLESYLGVVGLGANVFYERFNLSSALANAVSGQQILKDHRYGSRVYLIFSSTSNSVLSISLQPYIAFPFSGYNLSPLAEQLGVTGTVNTVQQNMHYGLSIVFYNGAQR